MAVTSLYATRANWKLRVDSASAWTGNDDTAADQVLLALSRAVDVWCRVPLGEFASSSAGVVMYFTAECSGELDVPALQAVSALETDENNGGTYNRTWSSTDYLLSPANASTYGEPYTRIAANTRSNGGGWAFPVGVQNGVKVTGTWGWAATPPDITEAVIGEAGHLLQQSKNPSAIVASSELGRYLVEPAFLPRTMKLLAPYRRTEVRAIGGRGGIHV